MSQAVAEPALQTQVALAEGPLWHPTEQVLYWTDLPRGLLHRFDPCSGVDVIVHAARTLGCFGFRAGGGFVLGTEDGIFRLASDGNAEAIQPFLQGDAERRLNDGKVDPAGRFWFGSNRWDFGRGGGALHVLGPRGEVETAVSGLTLPNGLDWSPDGGTLYHADSFSERVDVYDFDPASAQVSWRQALTSVPNDAESPLGMTLPDGLTTDALGNVWVAIYGAGEVRCYSPGGELLEVVAVPVAATSSVTFGDPDLQTLYVTTGADGTPDDTASPAIFAYRPGVAGRPASFWLDGGGTAAT